MKQTNKIIKRIKTMKAWQKVGIGILILIAVPVLLQTITRSVNEVKHQGLALETARKLEAELIQGAGSPDLFPWD